MPLSSRVLKNYQVKPGMEKELVIKVGIAPQLEPLAADEARLILDKARQEADALLAAASREAELRLNKAREDGYREGFRQAMAEAAGEAEALRREARAALQGAMGERERILREAEPEVLKLACRLTEKLVLEQIRLDPGVAQRLTRQCIQELTEAERYHIFVNPLEEEGVRQAVPEWRRLLPAGAVITVVGDAEIKPGGCRVVTEQGEAMASLGEQMQKLENLLLGEEKEIGS